MRVGRLRPRVGAWPKPTSGQGGLDLRAADRGQVGARGGRQGPAGIAARLFSTSPPWACDVEAGTSTAARWAPLRSPGATRWSARGRDLSQVQAWKAATS